MGNLARHQELKRVFGARVLTEIDQSLVNNLCSRLGGNIAAQVNIQLAGNLKIIGCPRITPA
jgi:hypothetical protein